MIDHVGFEVTDLDRSGRFYDAVFFALGARRLHATDDAIAYGMVDPVLWLVKGRSTPGLTAWVSLRARGRPAVEAAHAAGLDHGGTDDGATGRLRDPDGHRIEIVS